MKWDHIIRNGTIVGEDRVYPGDIYVKDGRIAAITCCPLEGEADQITDAAGKIIFPGFIETHAHSRDGYLSTGEKEDFASSTAAAAATGITTLLEMPNCTPPTYDAEKVRQLVEQITPKAHVDFGVWGLAAGKLNQAQLQAMADAGVIGFKFFWGYAVKADDFQLIYNYTPDMQGVMPPPDDGEIYQMFREIRKTGKLVAIHAENFSMIKALTEEVRSSGEETYDALLRTRPVCSETSIIDCAIDIAQQLDLKLHILHVGAGADVEHIRRAKAQGLDISAETCSHYLALTDQDYPRMGAVMKTYPLVRTEADRKEVWNGLLDGTLDWVCSDHAPHTWQDKQKNVWNAPAGISGMEALSPVLLTAVNDGVLTPCQAAAVGAGNAAKRFGLYPRKGVIQVGADADLAIVDMKKNYIFDQAKMHSKAKWSPYNGMTFRGAVVKTILRGRTIMEEGKVLDLRQGQFVRGGQMHEDS